MKIKLSEIFIENISKDIFLKNWNKLRFESLNFEFIEKIILKVPIRVKSHKVTILVNSKLVVKENNKGILVSLYSDFKKCIIYSLLIGIIPSLLFLLLYSSIELFIISSLFISILILRMFYLNTLKLSYEYLKKIQENYV